MRAPSGGNNKCHQYAHAQNNPENGAIPGHHPDGASFTGGVVLPFPFAVICRDQYQRRVVHVASKLTVSSLTCPYQTTVWGASGHRVVAVKWVMPSASHVW
jgi:hypothetical protein